MGMRHCVTTNPLCEIFMSLAPQLELKARKRGAGWVTLWDHALDRDRGFFFFPFKNPRNSYSAQAQQRLPAAVVQDAAVDLANKLCVRKDAGAPG